MIIRLPYKVNMSINRQYYHNRAGKFLTRPARELRAKIIKDVREIENNLPANTTLRAHVYLKENWLCKNGEIKKSDLDNRLKFLLDSIFRGLEIDDKYIFEIIAKKMQSETEESTSVYLFPRGDRDVW